MSKGRKKNKNAGMTLVEVIVAITMLSLVAVPVLHAMTCSMYYNAKARSRQNVTLSVESLMETFKGYEVTELQDIFVRAAAGDDFAKEEIGVEEADGFIYPSDLSASELVFGIQGMQTDGGKTICDVEMKVSKQTVKELLEIDNIEPTRDAIFQADINAERDVFDKMLSDFQANYQEAFLELLNELDDREIELTQNDMDTSCLTLYQRELVFSITGNGSHDRITAYMEYTYYIKEHTYYERLEEETELETEETSEEAPEEESEAVSEEEQELMLEERKLSYPENIADYFTFRIPLSGYNEMAGEYSVYVNPVQDGEHPLQRLLIYYYPAYQMEHDDVIRIRNSDALALECHLIKQKTPGLSYAQLQTKETNYNPTVRCEGAGEVILYHNLNRNLADGSNIPGGTSGITTFSDVRPYIGGSFRRQKVLVYKMEMKVMQDGVETARFEGTMNEYMDN